MLVGAEGWWPGLPVLSGAEPLLLVPPGFSVRPAARLSLVRFPMFATLDDQARLYVSESSGNDLYAELKNRAGTGRIRVLEDKDHDGVYDTAVSFAENLPPCMGLVWAAGKLYAAETPDLVTWEDTDGDGRADRRTVVLSGFGHLDNGSLHGLTFGPDGWLYFTMGDPDGYDLHGPDGSRAEGTTGALIRCLPDGTRVETVARGFENLVEIVFLPDGSILGTVNWYQLPEGGVRDALVHILEGGQFPIHPVDRRVAHLQFNAVLPPVKLFPAVAHSGLEIYRGAAFPADYRGTLFAAEHNTRKVVNHRLRPKGASYSAETIDFVTTQDPDVHFSDVLEDRDGSLLIVDTGSWYVHHCPTGRIRKSAAPGGIHRVAVAAQPGRNQSAPARLSRAESPFRIGDLADPDPVRAAAAARMFGRRRDTNAMPGLALMLRSRDASLRLAAAEGLTHCGDTTVVPGLWSALAESADEFLEHAILFALHRLAEVSSLTDRLSDPSPRIQRGALLLLEQAPGHPLAPEPVVARLNASDPRLRDTARWVLRRHPEWGDAGAAFFQSLLNRASPDAADREALVRFLPLFQTNPPVVITIAQALERAATRRAGEETVRLLDALMTLDPAVAPAVWKQTVPRLLPNPSPAASAAALRVVSSWRIPGAEAALAALGRDPGAEPNLRVDALRELVRQRAGLADDDIRFLCGQLALTNAPSGRLAAADTLTAARLTSGQMLTFLKAARGDAILSPSSVLMAAERAGFEAGTAMALLDYLASSVDGGWSISADQLSRVQQSIPGPQRDRAERIFAGLLRNLERQRDQLRSFEPLLKHGVAARGETLFHGKAACSACHRVAGRGGKVGPDLSHVGAIRAGRDILESILLPSATIAQGYDTMTVTTRDGESFAGVRVGRNDDPLILRDAGGTEVRLHRNQIGKIEQARLSLMPEGLLAGLSEDEIRDLLSYLQQLK